MTIDVRLYLVTDPAYANLEQIVVDAVAGGVTCVQVRDKNASSAHRVAMMTNLRALLPPEIPVLANDDVAAACAGDGLHVGVDDISPVQARAELGPTATIGWSINDLAQLDDAITLAVCDYVAVSPVWDTPTKPDASRAWGLSGVTAIRARLDDRLPLVAIGGVHAENVAEVVRSGAQGVAVVSAICGADDPRSSAQTLRSIVDQAGDRS